MPLGRSWQDLKVGNSEACEGNVTCGDGEAWTLKHIYAENVQLSGSGSHQKIGKDHSEAEEQLKDL